VGESLSQPQDDPSPENITLAAGLGLHDTFELPLLTGSHFNRYSCWHNRQPTKSNPDIQSYLWDITLVSQLLNSGDIKSILVRKRGSVRGIRLVSVASIEAYLARLAKEQKDEGFARVVAKEFNKGRSPRPKPVLASTGQKGNGKSGRPRKEGVVA